MDSVPNTLIWFIIGQDPWPFNLLSRQSILFGLLAYGTARPLGKMQNRRVCMTPWTSSSGTSSGGFIYPQGRDLARIRRILHGTLFHHQFWQLHRAYAICQPGLWTMGSFLEFHWHTSAHALDTTHLTWNIARFHQERFRKRSVFGNVFAAGRQPNECFTLTNLIANGQCPRAIFQQVTFIWTSEFANNLTRIRSSSWSTTSCKSNTVVWQTDDIRVNSLWFHRYCGACRCLPAKSLHLSLHWSLWMAPPQIALATLGLGHDCHGNFAPKTEPHSQYHVTRQCKWRNNSFKNPWG